MSPMSPLKQPALRIPLGTAVALVALAGASVFASGQASVDGGTHTRMYATFDTAGASSTTDSLQVSNELGEPQLPTRVWTLELPASAGDADDSGQLPQTGSEGEPEGESQQRGDASHSGEDHDARSVDHKPAHHSGQGPYINTNAIPGPVAGHSERRIGTTDKAPKNSKRGASRTVCGYSHMNFDDAIVYPGQPGAAHLHTYFGNTAVNAHTTNESLNNSGNSTCRGGIVNRSGYWVPSVIDTDGTPVIPDDSHFYYKESYTDHPSETTAFPSGLRILAGADMSQPDKPSSRTKYTSRGASPYQAYDHIPDCKPGSQVTMTIHFPHCWVGEVGGVPVLDSANHRDHMAYGRGGSCPDSHPVKIPDIQFNILYTVPPEGTSGWRLSSDVYDSSLPAGYSLHGDWIAGWEDDVMEQIVAECLNAGKDCQSHHIGKGQTIR